MAFNFYPETFEEQDLPFPELWAFLVSISILSPKALPEAPISRGSLALQPELGRVSQDYIYHGHFFDANIKLLSS